jgi:putative transposase
VFSDRHLARMKDIMRAVCADLETELVEFNGENNHVHLLVNFPPKAAPAKLVNSLKGVSSRRIRQEFPDLARHYYRAWRPSQRRPSPPARRPKHWPAFR